MKKILVLNLIFISATANTQNPVFSRDMPDPQQEDILKPRKGQQFSKEFRDLMFSAWPKDARFFVTIAKQHFECLKNPECSSDFDGNRKVIIGPPGAGKTTLAQVIADELGIECVVVDAALLGTEYANSAYNNFARAIAPYKDRPCVIVLDEIDAIIKVSGTNNPDQKLPQQIWLILDKLEKMPHVLVIGTSNSLEEVPKQVASRFKDNIIKAPKEISKEIKKNIIVYYLKNRTHGCSDKDIDAIASSIPTYLGRDIEKLVKGASTHSKLRENAPFMIVKADFEKALQEMKETATVFEKEKEGWGSWIKNELGGDMKSIKNGVLTGLGMLLVGAIAGKGGGSGGGGTGH